MEWKSLSLKKKRLDALRPLKPELIRNLEDWFRVELTYTSNALEGNTLTRQETALILSQGVTIGGRSLREHLEASNHAAALDRIQAWISSKQPLGEDELLQLHTLILRGVMDDQAGRYRSVAVRISGSAVILPNPRKVPELMAAFGKFLAQFPASPAVPAFAAEIHYRLVSIHPFADGNGRCARLLMNLILLRGGYTPALIRTRDRLAYLRALEQAQLGGSKEAYENLIAKAIDRSLDIYLAAASGRQAPAASRESKPGPGLLKIGDLAKQAGETVPTIRHWTKLGLLKAAAETASGYTLYDPKNLKICGEIRKLQSKKMDLNEIMKELFE